MRNVPTFFTPPKKVYNKIKDPIKSDVKLSALWIGHATVLLQIYDKVIITDPFLTETMGELGRRIVEPGIDIENIPSVDQIFISHPHFDHLSLGSLKILEERSNRPALIFADGTEEFLPDYKMKFIKLDNKDGYEKEIIGESRIIDDVKITAVFAQHWGGRFALDGYVWGNNGYTGFIIEYRDVIVYFAGDTGYHDEAFKKIGSMYDIDLALIPIGPCAECEQPGTKNHVFPPESVSIFLDLNAAYMVPIHYATLQFAQAPPEIPLVTFNRIVAEKGINDKVIVLPIGGQKIFEYK